MSSNDPRDYFHLTVTFYSAKNTILMHVHLACCSYSVPHSGRERRTAKLRLEPYRVEILYSVKGNLEIEIIQNPRELKNELRLKKKRGTGREI